MRSGKFSLAALIAAGVVGVSTVSAAPFTAGDLAVFQAAASASNTTGSVVEVNSTTAAQSPTNIIPIDGATTPNELRFSGSATSTGYLSHSDDRSLLTFTGANSAATTGNTNTFNPRGVGVLDPSGTFSLPTTYTGTSGNQTRSATTLNDSTWFVGDQGGLYTNGSTSASPSGNFRGAKAFGGTVYIGQASNTVTTLEVAAASAPSGGTVTGLTGLPNSNNFQDFYLVQSGANDSAYDELYTVLATSDTAGTIQKFSLVSGSWTANGTYTTAFGGFGLAAAKDATSGADLYVTSGLGALTGNSLLKLVDTAGYNLPIAINTPDNVSLFTTPAGTILKGVDFAPVAAPEPASLALIAIAGATQLRRRRQNAK